MFLRTKKKPQNHKTTKPQNHKTTKPQNHAHRRTRFESLESRLCLSGCDISGTVYDARFAAGTEPLGGVQIFLDTDTDGVWDPNDEPWTITNGNGYYSFSDLEPTSYPATYRVAETVPDGYTLTTPALGYHSVTFNQEGSVTDKDFGNTPDLPDKVDIFILGDDTSSFGNADSAFFNLFDPDVQEDADEVDCLIELLQSDYGNIDWAFGVGRFEDYGNFAGADTVGYRDRPFILNQPIIQDDVNGFEDAITGALDREAPGGGRDPAEAATEALFQVATGLGFDGNNDGDTTDSGDAGPWTTQKYPGLSGDVPAFSTFEADEANNILDPSGNLPGVGFRQDALRIVILGTDVGTRYEAEDTSITTIYGVNDVDYDDFTTLLLSEEGTPYDKGAQIQETVTALNDLGIMVIGVGTSLDDQNDPRRMLEAYSRATGAVNEGDTIVVDNSGGTDPPFQYEIENGDPLYFVIDSSLASLAPVVEAAVENQIQCSARDISGNVWNDLDDDGIRDTGEPGKSGITVYLDYDGDGERDAGELRVLTDGSGDYVFENVIVGTAKVRVDLPTDWGMTPLGAPNLQEVYVQAGYCLNHIDFSIQEVTAHADTYLDDPNHWFTISEDPEDPLEIAVSSLLNNDYDRVLSTQNLVDFSAIDATNSVGEVTFYPATMTIAYMPAEDFCGTDTFLYSLTDGYDYTDWEIVTIDVTPVNDAPDIVPLFYTRDGLELTGDLAVDPEGDATTVVGFCGAEYGSFDVDNDGTFTYTPEPGFVGIDTIWVDFADVYGASSGDTEVTIAVCASAMNADVQEDWILVHDDMNSGMTVTDCSDGLLIVGSPDSDRALIYRESPEGWVLEEELGGDETSSKFGSAVAIRGTTAVVGAREEDTGTFTDMGAVYVFEYDGETWTQVAKLTPYLDYGNEEDLNGDQVPEHNYDYDKFGSSLAINEEGDTIVVGAPGYEFWDMSLGFPYGFASAGAAYVFGRGENGWALDQRLDPDDQEQGAEFGSSVDISHATILVGAPWKDEVINQIAWSNTGAAYVFAPGTGWEQTQKLTAADGGGNHLFGCAVAVWDNPNPEEENDKRAVISASGPGGGSYLFALDGTANQNEQRAYEPTGTRFGEAVDIVGDYVLIGCPGQFIQEPELMVSGAAYLIDTAATYTDWRTECLILPSTPVSAEEFGTSVAIGERGIAVAGKQYSQTNDQAAVHFFPFDNHTPAAEDMELTVAGATGTSYQCGSVFGIDPFQDDTVTYSVIPAETGDGYQEHGTVTFNNGVVTYTPTSIWPVSDRFQYRAVDSEGAEDIGEVMLCFGSPQIINRGIFYDGYFGDARDVSREASGTLELDDDNIVAHPDGITGVIIDVAFPTDPEAFSPADFACVYYTGSSWQTVVPKEVSVEVVTGLEAEEGTGNNPDYDCHRVRLTFDPQVTEIKNWLEVTMYDAGLGVSSDTFYFGYLAGDATGEGDVDSYDLDAVRTDWGLAFTVPTPGDINTSGTVNSDDLDLVRASWGASVSVPQRGGGGRSMSSSTSSFSTRSSTPQWTAEADKVYADYGIGDDDLTNDLAIDEKFWERLYEALGLTW